MRTGSCQTTMFIDVPWDDATHAFGFPGTTTVKVDVATSFTLGCDSLSQCHYLCSGMTINLHFLYSLCIFKECRVCRVWNRLCWWETSFLDQPQNLCCSGQHMFQAGDPSFYMYLRSYCSYIHISLVLLCTYRMQVGHNTSTSILSATTSMCLVALNDNLQFLPNQHHLQMVLLCNLLKCTWWILQCNLPKRLGVPQICDDPLFSSPCCIAPLIHVINT